MKKVLFIYDHKYPNYWKDGLYAALELLENDYEIEYRNLATKENTYGYEEFDFVLGWGGFGSPVDIAIRELQVTKGLCIAGNAIPPNQTSVGYDVLFYETEWYYPSITFHPNTVRAFGVNTNIYNHMEAPKIIDVLSVGSFSNWKRQKMMVYEEGIRLVIGELQINNMDESLYIANELISHGVGVMDMVPPESLAILYNMSKLVYIPSDVYGGGERAVWEAKACGVDVKVEPDNPKLKELLYEDYMDHIHYAEALKEGIESCIA